MNIEYLKITCNHIGGDNADAKYKRYKNNYEIDYANVVKILNEREKENFKILVFTNHNKLDTNLYIFLNLYKKKIFGYRNTSRY